MYSYCTPYSTLKMFSYAFFAGEWASGLDSGIYLHSLQDLPNTKVGNNFSYSRKSRRTVKCYAQRRTVKNRPNAKIPQTSDIC